MTDFEPEEDLPPVAHVVMVYNGPVAPHWELTVRYGDEKMLDDFWNRVGARLLLLPKHDPQFRRNRERVNRDAERERIICDWDLGDGDAESTITAVMPPPGAEALPPSDDPTGAQAGNGDADPPDGATPADDGAAPLTDESVPQAGDAALDEPPEDAVTDGPAEEAVADGSAEEAAVDGPAEDDADENVPAEA